jgi:hypothetical protein
MIGHGENIVGLRVTGDPPGILAGAAADVLADMLGILVRVRIYNHILKAEILAGIHYPDGYFASIRYKNLIQILPHQFYIISFGNAGIYVIGNRLSSPKSSKAEKKYNAEKRHYYSRTAAIIKGKILLLKSCR